MAKRRTYKRDKRGRGRFASTGSSRVKRVSRKINRRRPRYVRGSWARRCASAASALAASTPASTSARSSAAASAAPSTTSEYQRAAESPHRADRQRPCGRVAAS